MPQIDENTWFTWDPTDRPPFMGRFPMETYDDEVYIFTRNVFREGDLEYWSCVISFSKRWAATLMRALQQQAVHEGGLAYQDPEMEEQPVEDDYRIVRNLPMQDPGPVPGVEMPPPVWRPIPAAIFDETQAIPVAPEPPETVNGCDCEVCRAARTE